MNRATVRGTIFADEGDYAVFEQVLAEAREREAGRVRICCYVLMPNHFHLVLRPHAGDEEAVSRLMKWVTLTHAHRWHAHRRTAGTGALYGARFKSFPVSEDRHFLGVCRYVERNPVRARLVERAELWAWCSLYKRLAACNPGGPPAAGAPDEPSPPGAAELLDEWPAPEPPDWLEHVNAADNPGELESLRRCVRRGRPYGDKEWVMRTAERLGLGSSLRPRGRPRKNAAPSN